MDLTATAFGLLVTALGGLFTAVVLLARRELDRGREQVAELDRRLTHVEAQLVSLAPLARALDRKNNQDADRFLEGAWRAEQG